MDLLDRLSAEHLELRAHLERIEAAAEAEDDEGLGAALRTARAALTEELDAHIRSEEREVFGALARRLEEDLAAPFRAEHAEIRALRDEVLGAAERGIAPHSAALALCALLLDHQQREDLLLFPSAREAVLR